MTACPRCRAPLSSPLVCAACRDLLDPPQPPTPFEVFGLAPAFALDACGLTARLLELSRQMHPDFFAARGAAERERAERNTAMLNSAFHVLADELRRADWLVTSRGGPREAEQRGMPPEFLEEMLELNEAIERARSGSAADRAGLSGLAARLETERAGLMSAVGRRLEALPPPGSPDLVEVRRMLNAIRYLDRARREIAQSRPLAARPM
jgi:molecular chaperone HscB